MKSFYLLAVLLALATFTSAQSQRCASGSTKDTGCYWCATSAVDSDCDYCDNGYFKSGLKACTPCPAGTGRDRASAATAIETNAICTIKSAPQLKCAIASDRYSCRTCPAGSYFESGLLFGEVSVNGCSTDCKSLGGSYQLIPAIETPAITSCTSCSKSFSSTNNCAKCEFAPTLKSCDGGSNNCAVGNNKQQTKCIECRSGYYLLANKAEPLAVVPSCESCGTNCKSCKDNTECTTCWPGWTTDVTDKANCLKSLPVSSGNILAATLMCILATFVAW